MPLPTNMDDCMSYVKKEHPKGTGDTPKGKKAAHKQHVAMCLDASGLSKDSKKKKKKSKESHNPFADKSFSQMVNEAMCG